MINITLRSVFDLAQIFGKDQITVDLHDGADIDALLENLSNKFGEEFNSIIYFENGTFKEEEFSIMINGRNIFAYNGYRQILNDGDDVLILPIVGGG
jgi:MoaD family protein